MSKMNSTSALYRAGIVLWHSTMYIVRYRRIVGTVCTIVGASCATVLPNDSEF